MHCSALSLIGLALAAPLAAFAQTLSAPSDTLLAGITQRGRLLAAYDRAAWHGTDAVLAIEPESTLARVANAMIATRGVDGSWRVLFGFLTPASDTFYLSYEALPTSRPDSFSVHVHTPRTALVGPERLAAAALHAATADFGVQQRRYNSYVLPRVDGAFWVYFLPAQTDATIFPHGADIRYLVDSVGHCILSKHQMHNALLDRAVPDSALGGLHTVIVDDVPQDSDVFLVLTRHPRRPEIIATAHYNYHVALDGSITWERARRNPER